MNCIEIYMESDSHVDTAYFNVDSLMDARKKGRKLLWAWARDMGLPPGEKISYSLTKLTRYMDETGRMKSTLAHLLSENCVVPPGMSLASKVLSRGGKARSYKVLGRIPVKKCYKNFIRKKLSEGKKNTSSGKWI